MTRLTAKEYVNELRARHLRDSKEERGKVVDEFVTAVGCHRESAVRLLGLRIGISAMESRGFTTER